MASHLRALDQPGGTASGEKNRRRSRRVKPSDTRFSDLARLRPGVEVRIVDISTTGMLLESPMRLPMGQRVEIALASGDKVCRLEVAGAVRRCEVASLSPLTYRGAVEFDRELAPAILSPFVAPAARTA